MWPDEVKDLERSLHIGRDVEPAFPELTNDEIAFLASWLAGEGFKKVAG